MVGSGSLSLLKVECDKIRAAPCEGCLRTLVEGIKTFIVRPGVKILKTSFPVRPLRSNENVRKFCFLEFHERWNTNKETYFGISYLSISCLKMLETSVLGLGKDLGLLLILGCAMTNSAYVSRYNFNLIPYRFKKVCDRFSAYTTCMVGTEHLSKDNL
ncbi:hypothetical protein YC2023_041028 [Brassica napus]